MNQQSKHPPGSVQRWPMKFMGSAARYPSCGLQKSQPAKNGTYGLYRPALCRIGNGSQARSAMIQLAACYKKSDGLRFAPPILRLLAGSKLNTQKVTRARQAVAHVGGEKSDGFRFAAPILRLFCLVSIAFIGLGLRCPALAQVSIPAVLCNGNFDQTQAPLPKHGRVKVILPTSVAAELGAYVYDDGMMLGPRGWTCFENIRPTFISLRIYPSKLKSGDTGVSIQTWTGEDPWANISIIKIAGTYFPQIIDAAYVEKLLNDDPDLNLAKKDKENFLAKRFVADRLEYVNKYEFKFVTPREQLGLGAVAFANNGDVQARQVSSLRTSGITCLVNEPRLAYQLLMAAVRLPKSESYLSLPIEKYAQDSFLNCK